MSKESEKKRKSDSERFRRNIQMGNELWDILDTIDTERKHSQRMSRHNSHINDNKRFSAERNFVDRMRKVGLYQAFKDLWSKDER